MNQLKDSFNSKIWTEFIDNSKLLQPEYDIYRRHVSSLIATVFGVMVALHHSSNNALSEILFLVGICFLAISIVLTMIGCRGNYKYYEERSALLTKMSELQHKTQIDTKEQFPITKRLDTYFFVGFSTFILAIIISFVSVCVDRISKLNEASPVSNTSFLKQDTDSLSSYLLKSRTFIINAEYQSKVMIIINEEQLDFALGEDDHTEKIINDSLNRRDNIQVLLYTKSMTTLSKRISTLRSDADSKLMPTTPK